MPLAGFFGVAVTFIAPLDTLTLATASSATARHDVVPVQATAFIGSLARSPDQALTAPVAALMTALLPLRLSSEPTETQATAVGQVTPDSALTPGTGVLGAPAPCAALAAAGTARIAVAATAATKRRRVPHMLKLPPRDLPCLPRQTTAWQRTPSAA